MPSETNLMPGIWYGPVKKNEDITLLKNNFTAITSEKDCILSVIEVLKSGDFTIKNILIDLMNTTKNEAVLNLCIRLFCSVSNHDDLLNSNNLKFLSEISDSNADTFASCAPTTLSYDVVPYLLAMLEEWEDTYVEQTIKDSLDTILGYTKYLSEEATVEEIGQFYLEKRDSLDAESYYYSQQFVFPGDLAKKLIEKSFIAAKTNSRLEMGIIPSLLSIWSGVKCPVEYDTVINDNKLKETISYIDKLSKMDWQTGVKYFYANPV
ncbi:Imm47 family immunity protein [Bacillus sp. DX1.1]|uniref:Imm47 family immunity protein n=1 Tax=unclassified Bacillus (in: firmicutes) TaxID=185979 RepID=UPI002570AE87|nr:MULTISPECIES: Imm47 family immunity protein [unclassified Bacillus (in: firmicutes)]MDM5154705.1 Imm47 family immunity protein [Bacillus sp. DX1.1]WJE83593.1 Imm47 family immunity protein [Bacillus sp. DX3.1]